MSISTDNHDSYQSDDKIMELLDQEKGSDLVSYTFYGYILFFLTLVSVAFFYYAFKPQDGFFYLYLALCVIFMAFGFKQYDAISTILLFSFSAIIAVFLIISGLVFTDHFVLLFYVLFFLLSYTLFFDKRTQNFIFYKFNKNLKFFYIVLLGQYIYLILQGFLNLNVYTSAPAIDLIIFYTFLLLIMVNLILVQAKFYNARSLMFFTSTVVIIYSLFTIFTNILALAGIILNIATLAFLVFDKKVVSEYKQSPFENRLFLRITLVINLVTLLLGFIGSLYLYSTTYEVFILFTGIVFSLFYFICIYEVNRHSQTWKYIMTGLMVILIGLAIYFGESFATFTLIFGPVAFLTIFILNFNYQTRNLFKKGEEEADVYFTS